MTFNGNGLVVTDLSAGSNDQANDLIRQSDGKLVVAGLSNAAGHNDFTVARYTGDGNLDTTFSADGWATIDFGGGSNDQAYGIVEDGGTFIVAGITDTSGSGFDVGLARIAADLIFADGFD